MISYRDRARANAGWPPKAADWEGRFVRPRHDMVTAGGTAFAKGEKLRVDQVYRGKLVLRGKPRRDRKGVKAHTISGVMMLDVELIPNA